MGKVFIVDDDPSVGKSLVRLLGSFGHQAEVHLTASAFLQARKPEQTPSCLLLDLKMPDMDGFALQERLLQEACSMPVVFMSAYGDIPSSVRAMKRGAVSFLSKPLDTPALIEAIQEALAEDAVRKQDSAERTLIHERLGLLTEREQEIFSYVITGLLNKQIASALNISEKTVKAHRGRVMQKMRARSLAELVRMAHKAGITPAASSYSA